MADTKTQNPTSEQRNPATEQQRGMTRRQEYYPTRDAFYFSPFSMMRRLSDEMDRAFSSTFGSLWGGQSRWGGQQSWTPAVEVHEKSGNIEVIAELPGLNKDDVKVECTQEGVIIEGEKKSEHTSEEGGYCRSERTYGHFYRLIPLPEGAQTDKATAEFKNGVLQVRVPIPESQSRNRRIPITG